MLIRYSNCASKQLDSVYGNNGIYDRYGHFTQQFLNWNSEFHRFVNPKALSEHISTDSGIYVIGDIGALVYNIISLEDTQVIEVMSFVFSRLPYTSKSKYKVISDAGYGYKIVQSTFNGLCAILTPQRRLLTKYAFDGIIGFHHSSDAYNVVYAVGFIGDRVYAIYPNGEICLLPYSKEGYLKMKHKYYESRMLKPSLANYTYVRRIVAEAISRTLRPGINKAWLN